MKKIISAIIFLVFISLALIAIAQSPVIDNAKAGPPLESLIANLRLYMIGQ